VGVTVKNLVIAAAGALALVSAGSAQALTYEWSFDDTATGQVVDGTISGLVEGQNALSAVTVTLLGSADASAPGTGWAPDTVLGYNNSSTGFTVTDGLVTFASGLYTLAVDGGTDYLFFGSSPGVGTYYPQLVTQNINQTDTGVPEQFSAIPEPSSWALMIAGFGLAGAGLRLARRRAGALAVA
jgi:PEP-CTERM motif